MLSSACSSSDSYMECISLVSTFYVHKCVDEGDRNSCAASVRESCLNVFVCVLFFLFTSSVFVFCWHNDCHSLVGAKERAPVISPFPNNLNSMTGSLRCACVYPPKQINGTLYAKNAYFLDGEGL